MTTQPINARSLLRETFAAFPLLYVPMLLIAFPGLILNLLNSTKIFGSTGVTLNILFLFYITPLLLVCFLIDPSGKLMLIQIISGIMAFYISPFIGLNFVLLYMRIRNRTTAI